MNIRMPKVDLSNCDREPIQELGLIQPFGALVSVNNDWMIAHYSANVSEILGRDVGILLGKKLSGIFSPSALDRLRDAATLCSKSDHVERIFGIELVDGAGLFDCALHGAGKCLTIEFEPHDAADHADQISMIRPMLERDDGKLPVEELCSVAAEHVRNLLGFDRVMVYKFHDDGSGEVIAEDLKHGTDSFFGLRYPHTDIPRQARQLYLRNRFRIIADVNAGNVPIEPLVSMDKTPLDLSMSTLRAVSPIHIEYLKNMGVEASLSISIVIGGELWGLFACHHYEPRPLPYSKRTAAELISEVFSLKLDRALNAQIAESRRRSQQLHERLMRSFADGQSLAESFDTVGPIIGEIVPCDGASVWFDGVYNTVGSAPTRKEFEQILPALNSGATSQTFATSSLQEHIPAAKEFADRAAGALIIPVSRSPRDYLVLWRKELAQVVHWGGNPEKAVEYGPNGMRLTPRKSFEAWQEDVEGHSEPWSNQALEISRSLRVSLLEVILRLTDEAVQERAKAQQKQELLIAELNHRVRNILNLIRSLISQSRHQADTIEEFSALVGGRISALSNAHDNITRQNWTAAAFRDLLDSETEAYLSGKSNRINVSGINALIAPEAYTVLALVIHEMITNAAKYGSLSDSTGRLDVELERDEQKNLRILWREHDGPKVKEPSRRGFGSTIIEKSIPFELGGKSEIEYAPDGVSAQFLIPAKYVRFGGKVSSDTAAEKERVSAQQASSGELPKSVLLVEDSMLIAMDVEDCLSALGVTEITVASTVPAALEIVKDHKFDLAILDFNLGDSSSKPVAKALREKDTPFVLASGYGDMGDQVGELGAAKLLTKPYGKQEIEALLAEWQSY
ncbi:HWE histidine kinase domain-containing protein [Qipengyuania atrilutea]|uniref:histidine kinase n=1 Tax=Qipengyuania atrilutea TaxID=2744473 RepID=A0A850H6S6_9SPHN|nr:HWE histidine kinase domain-containing protein [Actirhodobacter atriluteus]NVD45503.1 GAF domain-containing protein [Actirhodobacter atriluteus]